MNTARNSLVVVALTAVGLVAGLAGTTSAGSSKRVHGFHQFQSPSGNIGCEIVKKFVRCDIKSRDWRPPAAPTDCQLDYGQGLEVGRHGKGRFVCAGDTALNPQANELGYGHSIRDGALGCVSKTSGMRCKNHKTGHGFFLSKASYRRF